MIAAAVLALSAAPAGATEVCSKGHTPPSPYCTNVKPKATTTPASNLTGTSATLNGVAGAGVSGGDPTQFHFEWGTSTRYGNSTPTQTLGSCQPGHTPPSTFCTTPSQTHVSSNISGLTPCATYHYRLDASNPDGTANGVDMSFRTPFAKPIQSVHFPRIPRTVRRHHKFKVTITLRFSGHTRIFIKNLHGRILKIHNLGTRGPGRFTVRIRAPKRRGTYRMNVFVRLPCGHQESRHKIRVR